MTDAPTKAEKLAHNAVLTLVARALMAGACLIGAWGLKEVIDIKTSLSSVPSKIEASELRITGRVDRIETQMGARISTIESRVDAQFQRLQAGDARQVETTQQLNRLTVDIAVLVERINALIAINQPPARPPVSR